MATFNKIEKFSLNLGNGEHDLATNQLTIALTNTAHTASWDQLSDLTEISYTNLSARNITTTSFTQTSGTATLVLADLILTASGGSVAEFQYVYVYDNTSATDKLIGYVDYGSGVTLADTETFTIDFAASTITIV